MGCCHSTAETDSSSTFAPSSSSRAKPVVRTVNRTVVKENFTTSNVQVQHETIRVPQRVESNRKEPELTTNRKNFTTSNVQVQHGTIRVPQRVESNRKEPELTTNNQNFGQRHNVQVIGETKNVSQNQVSKRQEPESTTYTQNYKLWDEVQVLCETENVPLQLANNFITLLNEGCTLPFIARYRKNAVFYLMPDRLQELFESYKKIVLLKKKVKTAIETLRRASTLTPDVEKRLLNARSLGELDLVYGPLKSHSLTLAERARKLGLEPHAERALNGELLDLRSLCGADKEISTVEKVEGHITHLIADIIHTDRRILIQIKKLKEESEFIIQSTCRKSIEESNDNVNIDPKSNPESYKLYFEWKCPARLVKPHQTLALNRGEDAKILTVKVVVPDRCYHQLEKFCLSQWRNAKWVKKGLQDAYSRLIKPWFSRQVRSDLNNEAYKEGVHTFTSNLEKFLLTEPIKNRNIAGVDPGFTHGCKVGMINCNGENIHVSTMYPDLRCRKQHDPAAYQFKRLLSIHNIEIIGLGNGTACRETEMWLKHYGISENYSVIIVPEQGASIYSVSKEAQMEHPDMDPNLISALSIARRVLDPLGELIKVEPKHLGIGLYQHSIPTKILENALDSTVEKIVSLVGVDINTASLAMLRRISGLNETRAKNLIAYRQRNGNFTCRTEVLEVPGIERHTYRQCIGFLKILGAKEPLDSTIIHPESYSVAKLFAKKIGVNINNLTQPHFPQEVERKTGSFFNIESMSHELGTDTSTLELIIHAFKQKHYEDNVISFCRPVYSVAVQATEEIYVGLTLTGVVRNVVPFGCFVDCGVGDDGLIHRNHLRGNRTPQLGERVSVTVIQPAKAGKISLRLESILD